MASTSSREAALERRKALTNGGKKASSRFTSGASRVRSASDARPSRTAVTPAASAAAPASAAVRPAAQLSSPARSRSLVDSASQERREIKPIANPSRELVLSRRQALSRSGKRASTSRDRTRTDLGVTVSRGTASGGNAAPAAAAGEHKCKCHEKQASSAAQSSTSSRLGESRLRDSLANRPEGDRRSASPKRSAQYNPSRALVLARREALSKRGKSATISTSSTAASMARQGNPDLTSRELAQKVRELKTKVGSAGCARNGSGSRPCGPNRHGSKQQATADAHWKVGVSETSSGQIVTGTQANRSVKTTGNEAATCRPITGTEYLGAEVFQTFCQSGPVATQPAKVRVSDTSHGNRVTGNEVGRSEKVTGDEPGTCKNITGTEYISANQSAIYCGGTANPSPRKVGLSQTQGGQPVSGVMVGRSQKVTGDEPGSGLQLTGDQYLGSEPPAAGRSPAKVGNENTLRGTGVTGTTVGRSDLVTGDEAGSCKLITGDEYIGSKQYDSFCGSRPAPEAAKVGFSITNRTQVVSGTRTGRSSKVTGDEPGTCKVVTGTPYAGLEQASDYCSGQQLGAIRSRTPVRGASRMSGIQPGIGGVMTGAQRGACEPISGTPYVGADQLVEACGAAVEQDADFPQSLSGTQPWQQFSVQSPAQAAQVSREQPASVIEPVVSAAPQRSTPQRSTPQRSTVTGSSYEFGSRVTGPFDMAGDKVTGTEQFRSEHRGNQRARGPIELAARGAASAAASTKASATAPANSPASADARALSRVTGEGITAGLKITGDDWDRGERVTGTEGVSARRRNPSRPGQMSAMPSFQNKRNEQVPEPVSRVTGSSGNTQSGSLITVSGGARG